MYRVKHAKCSAKFSFASCLIERPRFVATKKMKLLSGNPDGFAFTLSLWLYVKLPDFSPLLPQPMTNGLTAISRANCLRR
jgi:hypothetical protein